MGPGPSRRDVLRAAPASAAALGIASLALPGVAAHASVGGDAQATSGPLDVRPFLSSAGRTAHDAVADGALFLVDAADLAAVTAGLAATMTVTTTGMSDALMAERGTNWTATTASTLLTSVWPAGAYLLGGTFGVRTDQNPSVSLLRGGRASGDPVAVAGAVGTTAGPAELHVLRRAPVVIATDAYLACVGPSARTTSSVGTFRYATGPTDVDGTPTYRTWLTITGTAPRQQYLLAAPAG